MAKQEFLLLIPAIIYGVAIVDLLKIFQHRKNYWEVMTWGILLMIIIVNIWTELYQKLDTIVDSNFNFFMIIAQAILYAQAASVITPEREDDDTRTYFFDIRTKFFLIVSTATAFNLMMQYLVYNDDQAPWIRPLGVVLMLLCAFVDRVWLRTIIWVFIAFLAIWMIFIPS